MPRGFDETTWLRELPGMTLEQLRGQLDYWRTRLQLGGHAEARKTYESRVRAVEQQLRERFPDG